MIGTASQIVWVSFQCKTKSNGSGFQLCLLWWYRGPGKVIKIQPKHLLTVLTGNDKSCTTNCVSMFRVPNVVIWTPFSTLVAPVVPGLEKVVKIGPKHFSVIPMGRDKNCVPNSVGNIRVQNQVIQARFSTLPVPMVARPGKVVKIRQKHFLTVVATGVTTGTANKDDLIFKIVQSQP